MVLMVEIPAHWSHRIARLREIAGDLRWEAVFTRDPQVHDAAEEAAELIEQLLARLERWR